MSDYKELLKNPIIAACLALIFPGAGHLYQRRFFKAGLYSVCIMGTFLYGLHLGEWKTVYLRWEIGHKTVGYLSQMMVGLPAWITLVQRERYEPPDPRQRFDPHLGTRQSQLDSGVKAPFRGLISYVETDGQTRQGEVDGQILLENMPGAFPGAEVARGTFTGMLNGEEQIQIDVGGPISIGPRIYASEDISPRMLGGEEAIRPTFSSERRYLQCTVLTANGDEWLQSGSLEGTIPRAFLDWFQVPLEENAYEDLHGRLGKQFALALVYTWIAGLLNLLAVWDALEGPAYGYGDEPDPKEQEKAKAKKPGTKAPQDRNLQAKAEAQKPTETADAESTATSPKS